MVKRRQILDGMTRNRLLEVARAFDVGGLTGRPKPEIVAALAKSRVVKTEDLVGVLDRAELKAAVHLGGLDPAAPDITPAESGNPWRLDDGRDVMFLALPHAIDVAASKLQEYLGFGPKGLSRQPVGSGAA